jgi:MFS family permease
VSGSLQAGEEKPEIASVPTDGQPAQRRVVVGRIGWKNTFAAFRHRNFQLFFAGQGVSLVGTWMQMVAEGWLVYQLSHSPFTLGFIRFLNTIPFTVLTLVGGAVADRMDKRRILIATQTVAMALAFTLAGLVHSGTVKVWHVAGLAFLLGIVNAFDVPARQSFVVEMVGKEDLMNAIALNSSMFNGARVFGPALAGVLIGVVGLAGCFTLNGLSFMAVIAGYMLMRMPPRTEKPGGQASIREATVEAVKFVANNRILRTVLSLVALVSLFGWPYSVLMPVFAKDILHVGATGYGCLMAVNGLGALLGALTLASLGGQVRRRKLLFTGVLGFSVMTFIFALSRNVWLSGAALACGGWFMIIFFATANTSVQLRSPDALRGRIMGIYALAFIGLSPVGSLLAGTVARETSAPFAIAAGAVICAVAALVTMRLFPAQTEAQRAAEGIPR